MPRYVIGVVLAGVLAAAVPAYAGPPPAPAAGKPGRVHGAAAQTRLGGRLPEVARRHGLRPEQLRAALRSDPTLWLDRSDRLLYVDPPAAQAPTPAAAATAVATAASPSTFQLHSRPGAARTIMLDFDGQTLTGTAWNDDGLSSAPLPPFDLDGVPGSFSTAERQAIQSVWQRVSEDFAPFDVDVTTQEPSPDQLTRSGDSDTVYGTRAVITPSSVAELAACGGRCGGVAYVGVFDEPDWHAYYQPALVFSNEHGGSAKFIAEAVSHEVGHNLGLEHDGDATSGYSTGHGAWAPIMGAGYYRPVTQWSAGSYAGANNQEDDLAVMQSHGAPLRTDDHGDAAGSATALAGGATASGVISDRDDRDWFSVDRPCPGVLSVTASTASTSPDLDVRLRLVSADGAQVAVDDPVSTMIDADRAGGLTAAVRPTVSPGTYFVEVDGVGALDPLTTGYDDYGSLGAYRLTVSACPQATTTTLTTDVAAPVTGQPLTLTAAVVATAGSATPTGTVRFYDGTRYLGYASLAAGRAALPGKSLTAGEHQLTAAYAGSTLHAPSTSPADAVSVALGPTTTTLVAAAPSAVVGQAISATATVRPVAPSGGTPTGYVRFSDGAVYLGQAALVGGVAALKARSYAVGPHTLTATYVGSSAYATSTSAPVGLVVAPASTVTAVQPPSGTAVGTPVSVVAAVTSLAPSTGVPTGTVRFYDGKTYLGYASLSAGRATLASRAFSLGPHVLTAVYAGGTSYTASTSPPVTLTSGPASG